MVIRQASILDNSLKGIGIKAFVAGDCYAKFPVRHANVLPLFDYFESGFLKGFNDTVEEASLKRLTQPPLLRIPVHLLFLQRPSQGM